MGTLTKYNALVGELEPYSPSAITIQKALSDVGINDSTEAYDSSKDRAPIAKAAIYVLKKLIVLSSDSLGKSSQSYNVDQLKKRIHDLCNEAGLDISDYIEVPTIENGSNRW